MENDEKSNVAASGTEDHDVIFALDIGTRSVIGIVGVPEKGVLRVLAVEEQLHTHRAVVDGQIEDIAQTAIVAQAVKERLEQKVGVTLRDVCIAAAGRLLKTQQTEYELELDERESILEKQIMELETGAIQKGYELIQAEEKNEPLNFLCVGHSVMSYWLDGYEMSTLLDHRGKRAKARVIATFLPSEVVESLYAVMMRVGLTVTSMTLEPIAAMNAVIPRELRMLNLALVDIGGGTSDIAISDSGSVVAYTMATVAGDEVTETIMRECLVDFDAAEQIKMDLSRNPEKIVYQDILGFPYELTPEEVSGKIGPTIETLADEISGRILAVNGKGPAAVFLVGGGCQLPMLCQLVAGKLGIDEKKVAIGGNNYMKRMVSTELDISGPEFATPVGIAVTAMSNRLEKGFSATVNGNKVTLLRSGTSTVLELLLMSGCQYGQIMGRSGASVVYELNGERRIVRGGHSIPAEVRVNGGLASVSTPVHPDDAIVFQPARSGADAAPTVESEIRQRRSIKLLLGGSEQTFSTRVLVNGMPEEKGQPIRNGDKIQLLDFSSPEELFTQMNLDAGLFRFRINGVDREKYDLLADGDILEAIPQTIPKRAEPAPPPQPEPELKLEFAVEPEPIPEPKAYFTEEPPVEQHGYPAGAATVPATGTTPAGSAAPIPPGNRFSNPAEPVRPVWPGAESPVPPRAEPPHKEPGKPDRVVYVSLNGSPIELHPKEDGTPYQFVDMLNFVDIDFSKPQGNILLKLNGRNASYLDMVRTGDQITIQWDRTGIT